MHNIAPLLLWSWGSPFSAALLTRSVVKRPLFYSELGLSFLSALFGNTATPSSGDPKRRLSSIVEYHISPFYF